MRDHRDGPYSFARPRHNGQSCDRCGAVVHLVFLLRLAGAHDWVCRRCRDAAWEQR